ncbi:MAG: hypothetical protein FWF94_05395 [Oscillospiraceae bacterium]|nr:hypothetical protein [Oscillospiraceae bacterium]
MKKTIFLLKLLVNFIGAIWGMVLGVLIPVSLIVSYDAEIYEFNYITVLWLITSVIGFVIPCFLLKFKLYKTAAALTSAGAVSLLFVFNAFPKNWWAYMPLLLETAAVILIMGFNINQNKRLKDNAPSESIIGDIKKETR